MQRDFFLSSLISNRGVPAVALPANVRAIEGEWNVSHYSCGDIAAPQMQALCRELIGRGFDATHIQFYYTGEPGRRTPCLFTPIADTASLPDEVRA
jgi:hypothetical protein